MKLTGKQISNFNYNSLETKKSHIISLHMLAKEPQLLDTELNITSQKMQKILQDQVIIDLDKKSEVNTKSGITKEHIWVPQETYNIIK